MNERLGNGFQNSPQHVQDCTNRQTRLCLYYKVFRYLWDNIQRDDRTVHEYLSWCIVKRIFQMYPDDARDNAVRITAGGNLDFDFNLYLPPAVVPAAGALVPAPENGYDAYLGDML